MSQKGRKPKHLAFRRNGRELALQCIFTIPFYEEIGVARAAAMTWLAEEKIDPSEYSVPLLVPRKNHKPKPTPEEAPVTKPDGVTSSDVPDASVALTDASSDSPVSTAPDAVDAKKSDAETKLDRLFKMAESLVETVFDNLEPIDGLICRYLKEDWSLERLPNAEKAILRLAVAEMVFRNLDFEIVINEAVELTKKYGEDGGTVYVNGMLNHLADDHFKK